VQKIPSFQGINLAATATPFVMLEPFVAPGISEGIAVGLSLTVVLSSGALIWVLQNVRFAPFSSVCEPTPGAPQSEQGTEILEDM